MTKVNGNLPDQYYTETYENNFGIFFLGNPSYLSNDTLCNFTYKDVAFSSVDQCIYYQKALFFNYPETAAKIMTVDNTNIQKQLTRKIKEYNTEIGRNAWDFQMNKILCDILYCKFDQNPDLKSELLKTYPKRFYYCHPTDPVMGGTGGMPSSVAVQMSLAQLNRKTDQNILGVSLGKVRDMFFETSHYHSIH